MGNPRRWPGAARSSLFFSSLRSWSRGYSVFVHRYNFRIDFNILRNISKIPRQLIAVRMWEIS